MPENKTSLFNYIDPYMIDSLYDESGKLKNKEFLETINITIEGSTKNLYEYLDSIKVPPKVVIKAETEATNESNVDVKGTM